jgi:hypothetical protein
MIVRRYVRVVQGVVRMDFIVEGCEEVLIG